MSSALKFLVHCTVLATAPSLALGQQFAEVSGRALPPELETVVAVAFVDADGDGDQDLVVATDTLYPGAPLQLLLNDGLGRFTPVPGAFPNVRVLADELAVADVDGDGHDDVFVANRDFEQNRLFLGRGRGLFVDVTASALPVAADDTRAAVFLDADRDGDLDLALGNEFGPDVLLLNDGTGRFTSSVPLPEDPSDSPEAFGVGDVDGDGAPDLVVANTHGPNRLWINDGRGRFTDVPDAWPASESYRTTSVVVVDVDRDGDRDVLFANHGAALSLYRNESARRFVLDEGAVPVAIWPALHVLAADVDADGDPDLVLANWGEPNVLLENDGQGWFRVRAEALRAAEKFTNCAAVADVDNDGDLDVVFGNGRSIYAPGRKQLYVNDGKGVFADATRTLWPAPDGRSTAIAAGDLDGDGHSDLVVGHPAGVRTWCGDGFGGLAPGAPLPGGAFVVHALAVADFDGDGDLDVVAGGPDQNRLFVNDGSGQFTDRTALALPRQADDTRALAVADVDLDGDLDLFVANAGSSPAYGQQNRLWINDGTGVFTEAVGALPAAADLSWAAAFGDVDGDGDPDLVVGNWTVVQPTVPWQPDVLLINDGTGRFTLGSLPPDSDPTTGVLLVDVDGDQDLDLVKATFGPPDRLFLNDGRGGFTPVSGFATRPAPSTSLAAGDVDLDGDVDLLFGVYDQPTRLLRNAGGGSFSDESHVAFDGFADATRAIVLFDVDGDLDPDLAIATDVDEKDRLLVNRRIHLETPWLAVPGRVYDIELRTTAAEPHHGYPWLAFAVLQRPIVWPGAGTLGVDPAACVALPAVQIPAGGQATFGLPVPASAALVGLRFFVQAAVLPTSNPYAPRLTGVVQAVVHG